MVGIKVIDENSNPLKGQNFEWCFRSYTSMGGEVVQGRNVNGLLGNGEWFDQLVRDLAGERLEGWEQGHLGRRHMDALMWVATKCALWILDNIYFLCQPAHLHVARWKHHS